MKKMRLLNGASAVFALAAITLATTLASCAKEEFKVYVESSPAKVVFNPNVIDLETGENLTSHVTFQGNETIVSTRSDKSLDAGKVTIKANYRDLAGSIEVSYPAVEAGQVIFLSPIIILSPEFTVEIIQDHVRLDPDDPKMEFGKPATGRGISYEGILWAENATENLIQFAASWDQIIEITRQHGDMTKAGTPRASTFPDRFLIRQSGAEMFNAGAWSMYNVAYELRGATIEYKVTHNNPAGGGDVIGGGTAASVDTNVYRNPSYMVEAIVAELAHPKFEDLWAQGEGLGDGYTPGTNIIYDSDYGDTIVPPKSYIHRVLSNQKGLPGYGYPLKPVKR